MIATRRTTRDIRSESRLVVMRALLDAGESTRGDLARETDLSVATVSTIVADLLKCGLVSETGLISQPIGRPTVGLRLNADRGRVVGVYVEETDLEVVVFDAALGELAKAEGVASEVDADAIIDAIERVIDTALQRAQANRDDVLGVGVLLPGGLQRPVKASPVPDAIWRHLDRLRDRLGLPVVVDNPLKAIATSQLWFGPGRRYANLVAVNLGVGVGAGIVQDGTVMRGATDTAGEWGHTLFAFDGRQCQCGRRGCVEAYVGAAGIRRTLAEIAPGHPLTAVDGHREFIAALAADLTAEAPDPPVAATVDRTAHYLGAALTDLVAIVNPEVITLTGWTSDDLGEHMLPMIRGRVRADAPGDAAVDLAIQVAAGRGLAGIAAIALERFLRDVGLVTTRVLPAL
jgi:predicted NBD/HSP70 family sugar kinase